MGAIKVALLATSLAMTSVTQGAENALVGCWRSVVGTSYLANGSAIEAQSRCTMQFTEDHIFGKCIGTKGPFSTEYLYKMLNGVLYEAELVNPGIPGSVGSKRSYEYKVEGDFLYITTYPQTTKPVPLNAAVKFVSKSVRDAKSCDPQ